MSRPVGADDLGVRLAPGPDRVLDVHFDGRRIWSFRATRDSETTDSAELLVRWPQSMRGHLNGRTHLLITDGVTDETMFEGEVSLGRGSGRIALVNDVGAELSVDNYGALVPTFNARSDAEVAPLLHAMELVIELLQQHVDVFLGYGTLLGAVREGNFIGHDSDVDLAYVSRHTTPVDVVRESFRLQRQLSQAGLSIQRYSGAAFKVEVTESDGVVRGLDVFGGFFDEDTLYLMGEIGTPFRVEWIRPLGECTLAGRTFPAPARADKMLEAMYGAHWQVPDPTFRFETPTSTTRALSGWFRGTRPTRSQWASYFRNRARTAPAPSGMGLAPAIRAEATPGSHVIDLGCGRGALMWWLARKGYRVTGFDYVPWAAEAAVQAARAEGLELAVRELNLNEWRSTMAQGAWLAQAGEPRVVVARHLFDELDEFGMHSAARFIETACAAGGTSIARFWAGGQQGPFRTSRRTDPDEVCAVLESRGATIRRVTRDDSPSGRDTQIATVIAGWER